MSDDLYKELLIVMPCLYDIQVQTARNITKMSSGAFQKARWSTGTGKQWPFVLVKSNEYVMNWAQIRERRAKAIESASPEMKRILVKVENAAHLMRVWNMSANERAVLEGTLFPTIQGIATDDDACIPEGLSELTGQQLQMVLPYMIDVPVTDAAKILRVSQHTMMGARRAVELKEWPLEKIRQGKYHMSADEVHVKRSEKIETLQEDTHEHRILLATKNWHVARDEAATIVRKAKRARIEADEVYTQSVPDSAANPQETYSHDDLRNTNSEDGTPPLIEDPVTEQDNDLKEWFASILEETGQQREERYWYDEGSDMTPEQQAYWDSLIDPIPDHI